MYQAIIVDDESFVVEDIRTALDWPGFNFELACCTTDPHQALTYLKTHSADLLITDIAMPQMTGIQLIQQVRSINPLVSILVLSAYDNFDYVRTAMRHGAENYLLKPLDPAELSQSVSHIAGHIRERAELASTYGSTMLTFRSNFIENWVKNTLSEEEFITRAEMLGINLHLTNYTVVIFSICPNYPHGKEKMTGLFDYLLSLFIGSYCSHFYFDTPTCLVCIISSLTTDTELEQLLVQMDNGRVILDFPFFVTKGNTVTSSEDVSSSYRNAQKYLFLQHSPLLNIFYPNRALTIAAVHIIEQDYTALILDTYIAQITNLLSAIPESEHFHFMLEVLNWGITQTAADSHPAPCLTELLKAIPAKGSDIASLTGYLHTFITACYQIHLSKQVVQTAAYPCVDAVIAAVHEFSDRDISMKTLAARLNMHPSYLGSIFHQQMGCYFNDYLNEERLKYAAGLIENTDMKLKDIVSRAGFSSQTYFNRQFKRKYGVTPNTYRREINCKKL